MVNSKFYILPVLTLLAFPAFAENNISMNTAQMQAMDKITGRVNIIEVPVNGEVKFGSFSVVVRSCKTRPEGEIPENFAFVDVADKSFDQTEYNIFKGWMFSSSPAVNAVEHPIYDVWLLKCFNSEHNQTDLLSDEQLALRDKLPMLNDIRKQEAKLKENHFETAEHSNIQIKDSIYKEVPTEKSEPKTPAKVKKDGEPENLLKIEDDYDSSDEQKEEIVSMPADELATAIKQESEQSIENALQSQIDADLSSAIDKELAQQIETETAGENTENEN